MTTTPGPLDDLLASVGSKEELLALVEQLADDRLREESRMRSSDYRQRLSSLFDALMAETRFASGELAEWKPGLKNKRRPPYSAPVVVIEHLEEAVITSDQGSGSTYFREPLDLIVGMVDEEDELVTFYVDSRRFRRYDPTA